MPRSRVSATSKRGRAVAFAGIVIRPIAHRRQLYDTVGNWQHAGGWTEITVSRLADWRHMVLVGVHELVEWALCQQAGVTAGQVDAFDVAYRGRGEPGDDPRAPYHRQHQVATQLERRLARALGVNWRAYGQAVEGLRWHHSERTDGR